MSAVPDLCLAAVPDLVTSRASLAAFGHDLEALAEGTEHLPTAPITYSRSEIYFDHD